MVFCKALYSWVSSNISTVDGTRTMNYWCFNNASFPPNSLTCLRVWWMKNGNIFSFLVSFVYVFIDLASLSGNVIVPVSGWPHKITWQCLFPCSEDRVKQTSHHCINSLDTQNSWSVKSSRNLLSTRKIERGIDWKF